MSDPRPPDPAPPSGPEPGREPEHEGVVEHLRHELEEVVEHVPQPVRWTVGKLVRLAVLSLLGLVVLVGVSAALYLANRTELVAHEAALLLDQLLAQRSDIRVEIRDIRGNPLTGFRVPSPRVVYRDGPELLTAESLEMSYSLWSLIRGGRGPVQVTLVKPVIRLDAGAQSGWRVPTWKSGASTGRPPRAIDFVVRLRDAKVVAPRPYGGFEGLDLEMHGSTGRETSVDLRRLSWARGPWDSRMERLRARFSSDPERSSLVLTELRTPDLALAAEASWASGSSVRQLSVDLQRVRWAWLAKVFDNATFDVPGEGRGRIDAVAADAVRGRFTTEVVWDSLAATGTGRFVWDGKALALDSVRAQSLAGDLEGQVRWSRDGWEVGGRAVDADPAHWGALRLVGWPEGDLAGRFRYAVDTRRKAAPSGVLTASLTASEWTGWQVDSAEVRVDFPAVARDSFRVVGWRRGGEFRLAGLVDAGRWAGPFAIRDLPLEEWPDGRATGLTGMLRTAEGTVESRDGELRVRGTLTGADTKWSATTFASWRADSVDGRLLPTPSLTAQVRASDGFFSGIHLDSAATRIELGDQTAVFAPLIAHAGDTLVVLTGSAAWDAARWDMALTSAQMRSDQFDWLAESPVRLGGDASGVVFDRLVARDGEARLDVRGRWASPGGFYDFTLGAESLDLARVGMPLDWGLGGRADARLRVTGRSGDPRWEFTGACAAPAFAFHAGDSLTLRLSGRAHQLDVQSLHFAVGAGSAHGAGRVDAIAAAWPESLTATAVVRWLSDAGSWHGDLTAERLPIEGVGRFQPSARGWTGQASGRLAIAGRPSAPRLDLEGRATDFGYGEYLTEQVETRARYADGMLEVPLLTLTMKGVGSRIEGRMPLALALGRMPEVPDAAMAWRAEVPRGDLRLLPLLVPQIQTAEGRFELDATVSGTTRHPQVAGSARVRDGTVRPVNREELVEDLYADLTFTQDGARLDSLSARQGREGRLWSKGTVEMAGTALKGYRFDLTLRDFTAREEGLYATVLDGDFVVVDGPRVDGQRLPQVVGEVALQSGVVQFDFANQSEVQKRSAATMPLFWTYRIHVTATNNLRWRPPEGEIELDADLDLEQTADSLIIYGEMHSLRGYYYFLSNRFTVDRADLSFDNLFGVDPVLDISATTRLRPTVGADDRRSFETIIATITGRSSRPSIVLTSASGELDQTAIIDELTRGRFSAEDGSGNLSLSDPLDNFLTRQLNNQLSSGLSEFFQGRITDWELQRQQGGLLQGEGGLIVGVGSQLTPQLALRYRERLPGFDRPGVTASELAFQRDVEAEYRINRFIYFTTELTQRRTTPGVAQSETGRDFNVNLKARWEY